MRAERAREPARNRVGQALRAPDEAGAVLDHEGETEGQQQAVERIAAIKPADQHPLDHDADEGHKERRRHQRAPEAQIGNERVGEITADGEKAAMGEIDDAGQVEDQRQPKRHQRVERADDEAVEDIEQHQLCHTQTTSSPPADHACRRGRAGDPHSPTSILEPPATAEIPGAALLRGAWSLGLCSITPATSSCIRSGRPTAPLRRP